MKKIISVTLAVIMFCLIGINALAATPYKSYNYIETNNGIFDVAAPDAYLPDEILSNEDLGVKVGKYEDLFIDSKKNRYILDSLNNAVYIFDSQWKLLKTIDSFENNGKRETFNNPMGIYVTEKDGIYVADTNNSRIVVLNQNYQLVSIISTPKEEILGVDFSFKPLKISVSKSGRIFVVAKDVFEGLMELTLDGQFLGFLGSNRVVVTPIELFWKMILTQKQNESQKAFIPVEYTNISLDTYGFIYAVTSVKNVDAPIKRLNPSGNDVLVRKPVIESLGVKGDYFPTKDNNEINDPSSFVDIVSDDTYGIYYALDYKRGRVFAYDSDGNILFIFGGLKSDQRGTFYQPTAIEFDNESIIILDREKNNITIFNPTEYAQILKNALKNYDDGNYGKSLEFWNDVLNRNCNLSLAYVKTGFCLYRMRNYKEAMDSFILAGAKEQYSKAFEKYMKKNIEKYFGIYATVFVIIITTIFGLILLRKRKKKRREK